MSRRRDYSAQQLIPNQSFSVAKFLRRHIDRYVTQAFVGKVSPEFCEAYEEEYEDELSFTAKGFWERHV
jgi:hypothetical protein